MVLPWFLPWFLSHLPREAFTPSDFSPEPPILGKIQNEAGNVGRDVPTDVHPKKWWFLLGKWCNHIEIEFIGFISIITLILLSLLSLLLLCILHI